MATTIPLLIGEGVYDDSLMNTTRSEGVIPRHSTIQLPSVFTGCLVTTTYLTDGSFSIFHLS